MDRSREQFEVYIKSRGMSVMKRDGRYVESATRFAHEVWKASRAVVEIELPEVTEKRWWSSWHGQFRYEAFWIEVRRVLISHGLKVVSK